MPSGLLDYLLTQGIKNHVEQSAGGAWSLWIEDDDLLDQGRAALELFRANPSDARYEAASGAGQIREQEEVRRQRRRKQFVDVRTRWSQPAQFVRPVTIIWPRSASWFR